MKTSLANSLASSLRKKLKSSMTGGTVNVTVNQDPYRAFGAGSLYQQNMITPPIFIHADVTVSKVYIELFGDPPIGSNAIFQLRQNGKKMFVTPPEITAGLVLDACDIMNAWQVTGGAGAPVMTMLNSWWADSSQYDGTDAIDCYDLDGGERVFNTNYNPAFLTGGTGAESDYAVWAALAGGYISGTIDGNSFTDLWVDTSLVTSMADVATAVAYSINTWWGGTLCTCTWNTDHFVLSSVTHSLSSDITALSISSAPDITGNDVTLWLDMGVNGVVTPPALGVVDISSYEYMFVALRSAYTSQQAIRFFIADSLGNESYWDVVTDKAYHWSRLRLPLARPDSNSGTAADLTDIQQWGVDQLYGALDEIHIDSIIVGSAGISLVPDVTALKAGDLLTLDCTQIGSTTPGADCLITLVI